LKGLALLSLAVVPPAIIVGGFVIAGTLVFSAAQATREKIDTIVETVNAEIAPRLETIGQTYNGLTGSVEQLNEQLDGVFRTIGNIQDLRIDPGQLGSSGARRIQVPSRDVSVGSGFASFNVESGRLMDETLPAISIPDRPVTIPITPLRDAFAPLGPNGEVGRAVQSAQGEIQKAVGEVKNLSAPFGALVDTASGWFAPLMRTLNTLGLVLTAMIVAVALLVLAYVVAGVWLAFRRRGEAAAAYRTGGELGYVLYVHRTLVLDGYTQLRGRDLSSRNAGASEELRQMVDLLRAQVSELRSELAETRMRSAIPTAAE